MFCAPHSLFSGWFYRPGGGLTVGAVYDRPSFLESTKNARVMDRATVVF